MVKLRQCFGKQSTSRQIVIIVVGIFSLVLVLASIEKILVYDSVRAAQQEIPQQFFNAYEKYSLNQTAILVKQLIFSTIDFRAAFMASLVNSIKFAKNRPIQVIQPNMSKIFKSQPGVTNCIIAQPNSTIFSCQWHIYTKYIMEGQWDFQMQRPTRRLTVIYQNQVNKSDVMIKSISNRQNLQNHTIGQITQKMEANTDGYLVVSNFYAVRSGDTSQSLVSFQTKLSFPNEGYNILIQMETYGTEFTAPLSKILYSDEINVAILAPKGDTFQLIASSRPLDQNVDFKCLLHEGYRQKKISENVTISSYTIPFSSYHRLGELNYAKQKLENEEYSIVVYTLNINKNMKDKIFTGINNLRSILRQMSVVVLVMIIAVGLLTIGISYIDMIKNFKIYSEMIRKYMAEPDKFNNYVNCKNEKVYPLMRNNTFLRMLHFVINMIEWKKKEFRRKTNHRINDQFPLNKFHEGFQDSQKLKDLLRFQQIYKKLEKCHKSESAQQSPTKIKKNNVNNRE